MKSDPIIQAVRDVRHQISESVDHDPQKLLKYYRKRQERYGDRLVCRQQDGPASQEAVLPNQSLQPTPPTRRG